MYSREVLGLADAERAVRAMIEEASKEPDRPMSVAVVDAWGNLISFARMDGATLLTAHLAMNKAYTAAIFGRDTSTFNKQLKEFDRDIAWHGDPRYTAIHGGVCVKLGNGIVVGAIGSSGRKEEEDEAVSLAGLKAIEDILPSSQ